METMKIEIDSPAYQDVLLIRKKVFVEEQKIPLELEIDETEKEAIYFLTYLNDKAVATGRLRSYGKFIKFERVASLKEVRGLGAGKHLMTTMLSYARSHFSGLTPYMHAQMASVPFYEKLGWRTSGAPFMEADIPHQAMIYT